MASQELEGTAKSDEGTCMERKSDVKATLLFSEAFPILWSFYKPIKNNNNYNAQMDQMKERQQNN